MGASNLSLSEMKKKKKNTQRCNYAHTSAAAYASTSVGKPYSKWTGFREKKVPTTSVSYNEASRLNDRGRWADGKSTCEKKKEKGIGLYTRKQWIVLYLYISSRETCRVAVVDSDYSVVYINMHTLALVVVV